MPRPVRTPRAPTAPLPWYRDQVLVVLLAGTSALVTLLVVGTLTGTRSAGSDLDLAGPVTRELLPVARLVGELAAVGVVAGLLACLLAVRRGDRGPVVPDLVRSVPVWALVWAVAAALSSLLGASEISNQTVLQVLRTGRLLDYLAIIPQARQQAATAAVALGMAAVSALARRRAGGAGAVTVLVLLVGTGVAVYLPLTTGHAASAANHDLAIASLVVHVLAALAWIGGLAALVVHLRPDRGALAVAVGRFDTVALTAFVVVALSGAVNAWTRIPAPVLLVTTTYGWVLLAKLTALVALGAFGAGHRRRTIRELRADRPKAFQRLAGVEVLVMTATVGLAVALSRTPTP